MPRRTLAAVLTTVALLVGGGCGSATSPVDDVPALATALDRVDKAVAAGKDDATRDAVTELVDTTTAAQEAGELDADTAARILQAAEALLAALSEAPEPEPEPETTAPSEPTLAPSPEELEEEPDEDDDQDDTGKTKQDKTKKDKPEKPEKDTKDEDGDEDGD